MKQWFTARSGFNLDFFMSSKHFNAFSGSEARAQPRITVEYVLRIGFNHLDFISLIVFSVVCTRNSLTALKIVKCYKTDYVRPIYLFF